MLNEVLDNRLTELKTEFEAGQRQLAELETRMKELQVTLYRISGAIQVLEELRRDASDDEGTPALRPRELDKAA